MGRTILAAVRTVVGVSVMVPLTAICAIVVTVIAQFNDRSKWIERVIQLWSSAALAIGPVTWSVTGLERLDTSRQYVFVTNHLSNFDIPLLFKAIHMPMRYLAKKELYDIPLLATAMRAIGIVKIDRQAHAAAHRSINDGVAEARRRGHSIIVFAEGTRSRDGNMHSFKKGAFHIAISNELPVVPVTVNGTWEVWEPGARIFYAGDAEVVIHEPIETTGMTINDLMPLLEQTRGVIEKTFEENRRTGR
jgi:1-acyl-sn-glycerol-3-phosphate acyltransferase